MPSPRPSGVTSSVRSLATPGSSPATRKMQPARRPSTSAIQAASRLRPPPTRSSGCPGAVEEIWAWLAADEHRGLLRLWVEAFARSLTESGGVWAGFAQATVEDWLTVLADCQHPEERHSDAGIADRTRALAILCGALLDLHAAGDRRRVDAAVTREVDLLTPGERAPLYARPLESQPVVACHVERCHVKARRDIGLRYQNAMAFSRSGPPWKPGIQSIDDESLDRGVFTAGIGGSLQRKQ